MKKTLTPRQALDRFQALCSRSEQCEHDLREKMKRWGIMSEAADKIIDRLVAERYLDNERYARAFVRDKYRFARWGRIKISASLRLKRIDSATISIALDEEIDETEYETTALKVLRAKLTSVAEPTTYEGLNKLFRHAMSRGYESAMIMKLLKSSDLWEE